MTPCIYDPDTRVLHARYTACEIKIPMEWDLEMASPNSTGICLCLAADDAVPDGALAPWEAAS